MNNLHIILVFVSFIIIRSQESITTPGKEQVGKSQTQASQNQPSTEVIERTLLTPSNNQYSQQISSSIPSSMQNNKEAVNSIVNNESKEQDTSNVTRIASNSYSGEQKTNRQDNKESDQISTKNDQVKTTNTVIQTLQQMDQKNADSKNQKVIDQKEQSDQSFKSQQTQDNNKQQDNGKPALNQVINQATNDFLQKQVAAPKQILEQPKPEANQKPKSPIMSFFGNTVSWMQSIPGKILPPGQNPTQVQRSSETFKFKINTNSQNSPTVNSLKGRQVVSFRDKAQELGNIRNRQEGSSDSGW